MLRNIISFKSIVILAMFAAMAGCSDKNETEALKKEIAEIQEEMNDLQRKYEAVCKDNAALRVEHRTLGTQLNEVGSVEDQLQIAQEIITQLRAENEELYITIENQQLILEQQEADLQELLDMLGITVDGQVPTGY